MDRPMPERLSINLNPDRRKEAWRVSDFRKDFHELAEKLAPAYRVSETVYGQGASIKRSQGDISINNAREFLNQVDYDPEVATESVKNFTENHKPQKSYFGTGQPFKVGDVTLSDTEVLKFNPDSKAHGRTDTIAVLAQRAARLESLLLPEGIPDAYATAQGQATRALHLVEKAASLAHDWNAEKWGTVNVDAALEQARVSIKWQRIKLATAAGALALAGCSVKIGPTVSPDITPNVPVTAETTPVPGELTGTYIESASNEVRNDFLKIHPEYANQENFVGLRIKIGDKNFDSVYFKLNPEQVANSQAILSNADTNGDGIPDTPVVSIQDGAMFSKDANGSWQRLVGIAIPQADGAVIYAWYLPDHYPTEGGNVNLLKRVIGYRLQPGVDVKPQIAFWPLGTLNGWDGVTPFYIDLTSGPFKGLANLVPISFSSTEVPTQEAPTDTPTPTPEPTKTPEPKPAEIILTDPRSVWDAINIRTNGDCLFSPWKEFSDPSEIAEWRQLRDTLHGKGIAYDGILMTGGNYPDPVCFIAEKGTQKPFNKTFWYLTVDGELDTFHIIVKSP